MQAIPTDFEDRTFHYVQIERHDNIAIYRQTHREGAIDRFEVVRIRIEQAHTWPDGHMTPERETYPGSTRWGRDGWTFFTLDAAQHFAATLRQAA